MSNVYVNLLGVWTNLEDKDIINGDFAENFTRDFLPTEKFNPTKNNGFCKVTHKNVDYIVHFTQIQLIY